MVFEKRRCDFLLFVSSDGSKVKRLLYSHNHLYAHADNVAILIVPSSHIPCPRADDHLWYAFS